MPKLSMLDHLPWQCWRQGHAWLPCILGFAQSERERIASQCQAWSADRFKTHGVSDARGAALWDVAAWLREDRTPWERLSPAMRLLAWRRHVRSHLGCDFKAWTCADGWYCGGCERRWDIDGRPEVQRP